MTSTLEKPTTTVEVKNTITVKPYVDRAKENMGLENYNMVVFDGVYQEEQLAYVENNGIRRYLTGLNEFAPEIKTIADPEEKKGKILEIRRTVAQLEKELSSNIIDEDDPQFWSKVKLLRPDNDIFWGNITMRCSNSEIHLNIHTEPMDLIKLHAIEAGGFSLIAKSFEWARMSSFPYKFYLDKSVDTISTKTEIKKLRNKALAELQKLFDKNTNKLWLVAKSIDGNSVQYKKNTPNDIVYDNMDKYINGEGIEKSTKKAPKQFMEAAALDMETLKLKAIVNDSSYYKYIAPKADGVIYHLSTNTIIGRNPSECVEFLKNPLNEKILEDLMKRLEVQWNK